MAKRKSGKSLHRQFGADAPKVLRNMIADAGDKRPLPERFLVKNVDGQPAMRIVDTETSRDTVVPLFAYGAVRQALDDLFGKLEGGAA